MKSPRHFAIIASGVFLALQCAFSAEDLAGTLTLKGEKIIFQTTSESFTYPVGAIGDTISDAKIVSFQPKIIEIGGKETNASELTLENLSDGKRFTLVESVPLKVIHVQTGTVHGWKLP
jgi:hypothetical protein